MKYRYKLIASTLAGAAILTGPLLAQQQVPSSSTAQPSAATGSQTQSSLTGQQPVSFDKLPAAAQQAIRSHAGQTPVASVNRANWNGIAYQAQYEKVGKPVYLQVAPDGTILNRSSVRTVKTPLANSSTVTFDQLPTQVQNTLTTSAGSSPITSLTKGTWHGTVYQAKLSTPGANEILVTSDGTVFKPGSMTEAAGAAPTGATRAFKDLPWNVQKPMLDQSGYAKISTVTQTTLPDGRTAYVGMYTKDGQQHQLTVDQNGTVVSDQAMGTSTGTTPSQ